MEDEREMAAELGARLGVLVGAVVVGGQGAHTVSGLGAWGVMREGRLLTDCVDKVRN